MPQEDNESRPDAAAEKRKAALEALRHRIDGLDSAILALVEQRVGAAREIAELKKDDRESRLRLRPAREAAVIERLVAGAGQAPEKLVRQIWREIMSCCLDLQVHTELVMQAPARPAALADATRRRFGCAGSLIVAETPAAAIEAARTREAVAVIEIGPDCDWWTEVMDDPVLAIFECLRDEHGKPIALALGRIAAEDLGACPDIAMAGIEEQVEGELIAACGPVKLVLRRSRGSEEAAR